MVSDHPGSELSSVGVSQELFFAGDSVRLAGQVDYPKSKPPSNGYPLIFVIQHATCTARKGYNHVTDFGTDAGAAVFRWDKRGTGSSGNGRDGTVAGDTLKAYQQAINLPSINRNRVVIFAQNEGTLLLRETYAQFVAIKKPLGIILGGNMLDETAILTLDVPVHIIVSKNDWNAWQIYAEAAADAHAQQTGHRSSFYVAMNTNRRLMYTSGNTFHKGAEQSIRYWLKHACQIST